MLTATPNPKTGVKTFKLLTLTPNRTHCLMTLLPNSFRYNSNLLINQDIFVCVNLIGLPGKQSFFAFTKSFVWLVCCVVAYKTYKPRKQLRKLDRTFIYHFVCECDVSIRCKL